MLKKHLFGKSGFNFLRLAFCGVFLLILSLSIGLASMPPNQAFAAANPQPYSSPKKFGGAYGFVFIDKDTILLAGEGPFKNKEVEFKRFEYNEDKYTYEGMVSFLQDDLTRGFTITIDKVALTDALRNNTPIPIEDISYKPGTGNDTNEISAAFADADQDQPNGYVFLDDAITNRDSVKELATGDITAPPEVTPDLDCEATFDNGLTYVMCPLINAATEIVDQLDAAITKQMTVDTAYYFDESTEFYDAWSSFRYIALALLVVIALVMILSEALSLDMFDAYSIRKILPRLLLAVILITLSWSLMKFAIDVSNNVGQGVRAIIYAPFADMPDASIQGGEATLAFGGVLLGIGALGIMGALSFALTAVMAVFLAFLVLVLRQMLIIFLIVFAPVAIVAYILPNTQKAWKIWWDFFSKALLAFPIIVAFIATGRVFSKVVANSQGAGILESTIAFAAYFLPYFMIPTAFKLAGGAIGTISGLANDRSKGAFDRVSKFRKDSGSRHREHTGRRVLDKRATLASNLQDASSNQKYGALSRFAMKKASQGVGGYNVQAASSARQAAVSKELNDQIATGRDEEIRGLTVNKLAAQQAGALRRDEDGHMSNGLMRINSNGNKQFKTLGGAWVNEGAVDAGHKRWGNDAYAQQTALSYEMRKAATDGEVQGIGDRYQSLATGAGGWGMSDSRASGALKGAGFENAATHLEFKHMNLDGTVNHKAYAREVFEKKGTYPMSQMSAHTIARLGEAYEQGDDETKQMVRMSAENFVSRMGSGGEIEGMADNVPVQTPAIPGQRAAAPVVQTHTAGSASVAAAVNQLAKQTGVYDASGPPPGMPQMK